MNSHLKTTNSLSKSTNRSDTTARNHSERQSTQQESYVKSPNYTRKSSRDLLNRAIGKESYEKPFKLFLEQPKLIQPVIKSERFKKGSTSRPPVAQQLNSTGKQSKPDPISRIFSKHNNNSLTNRELFCQKSKEISKKISQPISFQNNTTSDYIVKDFNELCSKNGNKLTDWVSQQGFQEIVFKLSGIDYMNVTKPIWNDVFNERQVNYLSVLNCLLALFKKDIHSYKHIIEKPKFMCRDKEEQPTSPQKRKVLIKKSTSRTKITDSKTIKFGQYCKQNNCIMFSNSDKQQICARYNYLKTEIEQMFKNKYQSNKQNSKDGPSKTGIITLKVHVNNNLTQMKIDKLQSPAQIARKFAIEQKIDRLLEHKLCFFLTKQFKNI